MRPSQLVERPPGTNCSGFGSGMPNHTGFYRGPREHKWFDDVLPRFGFTGNEKGREWWA